MAQIFIRTGLTGGTSTDVDGIGPTDKSLADGDLTFCTTASGGLLKYFYPLVWDADSGEAESSPDVIKPDLEEPGGAAYSGAGRWVLNYALMSGSEYKIQLNKTKTDDYSITTADLGYLIIMNAATEKTLTLPSVGSDENCGILGVMKIGAGKLNIAGADSDIVHDSAAAGTIFNDEGAGHPYPCVYFRYIHAVTTWVMVSMTGTWITTE